MAVISWALPSAAAAAARGPAPMTFEPNLGQADPAVKFLARGRGYGLFLTPTETVLVLAPTVLARRGQQPAAPGDPTVVRMRLVDAAPTAVVAGLDPLPGRSHYLLGARDRWRDGVPAFARVQYTEVYPGVSLVFYGNGRELEYDFVVAPGADPAAVALAFDGVEGVRIDDGGDLVLATGAGDLRLRRPVIYQDAGGRRRPVDGGYVLEGHRVRFRVAAWDASRPLVIDPVLGYSTFLGGLSNDQGFGIAVDASANAYVTGSTISSNFPITSAPAQPIRGSVTDAFVTKLSPSGVLVYSTFLGGNGDDSGNAIAVDSAGNAYVAGTTSSTNFPVVGPFQATLRGGTDGFVAKLDPSGSTLLYSTYLGSNTNDTANGIALDGSNNAYVTGSTESAGFPNNNAIACLGTKSTGSDAFVARLDASGATLGYCRFIGGSGVDSGQGIAADPAGNVWVVGTTTSSNLPVQAALQPTIGGRTDGFVGKLDPTGALVYLTFLGGSDDDLALAVAVDVAGNAYVTGSTASVDFPIQSPLQPVIGGGDDAFVSKLNAAGSALVFSTYLGGLADDVGNGIALHPVDTSVLIAGATESVDFPVLSPIQPGLAGRFDAFVSRFNPAGSALVFSTYLGGTGDDIAQAIAVDSDGIAYVTGSTNSTTFPTSTPIQGAAGLLDAFVTQIVEAGIIQFTSSTFQVSENGGTATIGVQRTGDTSAAATVQFATSDGTATAGADYTATSGTLTFLPGQITKTFTVTILPDAICDGDETVKLALSNPGGGSVLGARNTSVLTILEPSLCINFTADAYTVNENQGAAVITVARSGPATGTATVKFSTSDGTATAPADYGAVVNRTLTFGPGVRTVTVSIPIVNDTAIEGPETVNLTLFSAQGAALGVRSNAVLTIVDGDVGGVIQFASATYTVAEGVGTAKIGVIRTGSTAGGATVEYSATGGTATGGGVDFALCVAPPCVLTFGAGQTSLTFDVTIVADGLPEGVETVNLALSNPGPNASTTLGPRSTAVLRIVDGDLALGFSAPTYSVRENAGVATITVELTGVNAAPVTVQWSTADITAEAGRDYGVRGAGTPPAATPPPSGVLTFAPGGTPTTVRTRTFTIPILQDALIEDTETVQLTLSSPTGGAALISGRDTATLSILDDDLGGTIQFGAVTYTVAEGAGTAKITVTRTGGTGDGATVQYDATGGSAAGGGVDFSLCASPPCTLTFAAGQTSLTFDVTIVDDALAEGVETVELTLSNPGPNATTKLGTRTTTVLRIVDNELALGFSTPTYSVRENAGVATITVELTGVNLTPVTVQWSTGDITAEAGRDYGVRGAGTPPAPTPPPSGTLTFAPGGTPTTVRTRTFTVPILPDAILEDTETVQLTLTAPTGGAALITGRDTAILSILDDDLGGTIQFGAATYTVAEGAGTAKITVIRTGGTGGGATVQYAATGGTATGGDFTLCAVPPCILTFAAGQVSQTFDVTISDDAVADGVETVELTLSNPGPNATTKLGTRITTVLRIVDNDLALAFSQPTYTVREGVGVATITVELTGVNLTPVTVQWSTGDITAEAGRDYGVRGAGTPPAPTPPPSGTLTFAPGGTQGTVRTRTFTVPILQDTIVEPTESVQLMLTAPTGGAALVPLRDVATLLILDDDVGGVVQFSAPLFSATECATTAPSCNAVVTVSRTGGAASGVTANYTTADDTAFAGIDYDAQTSTVVFAAGQMSQTILIPLRTEVGVEPTKSFKVILSSAGGGGTLGARTTTEVRIADPR